MGRKGRRTFRAGGMSTHPLRAGGKGGCHMCTDGTDGRPFWGGGGGGAGVEMGESEATCGKYSFEVSVRSVQDLGWL